jgi:hypothetical protein
MLRIDAVSYDSADAIALIKEVQGEYMLRYGGPDKTPVDPAEFAPPKGLFLVGYLDEKGVACGGWRSHGSLLDRLSGKIVAARRPTNAELRC